ncbi:Sialyltransferase-like protein 1, partial [Mucuna pruriens]
MLIYYGGVDDYILSPMRQQKQVPSIKWRPTILYLVYVTALFFILLFYIQSSFFIDSLSLDRNFEIIYQCVGNKGLGLTTHIIDHCKFILKYPEGTNNIWYNVKFKKFELWSTIMMCMRLSYCRNYIGT